MSATTGLVPFDGVDVRPATAADVPALVCLYRRAYGENERLGFPSSMTTVGVEQVESWLDERTVYVATSEHGVVGAVHLVPRPDWRVPELGRLAVDPAHQRRGYGTLLLEYVEDVARDAGWDRLRLRTLEGHPVLADWYRRLGYTRVDVEPLEDRPYDAPVLEKRL